MTVMNIPRPANNKGHSEKLRSMDKGDEALFATTARSITKTIHRLGFAGKFTVRSTPGGVYVWRTK